MSNTKLPIYIYRICLLVMFVMPMALNAQQDWIKFEAEGDMPFSIDVPAVMGMKSKTITTQVGDLTNTTYALERTKEESPNFLYMVSMIDYPEGTFPMDSTDLKETYLTESITSLANGVNGEVLYLSDIDEGKNGQGKLFRLKYDEDFMVIKGKAFIKNDVFIAIQVYTTKDKSLNDEMDVFLDSFRVKEQD